MSDVLVYWRDYAANEPEGSSERCLYRWHSSANCMAELLPGDQMWMTAMFNPWITNGGTARVSLTAMSFQLSGGAQTQPLGGA